MKNNYESDFSVKNDSINLFAFIGEKISLKEFKTEIPDKIKIDSITGDTLKIVTISMDQGFNVKYKIIKNVYNVISSKKIDFIAFDHYGKPAFRKYKYVLLYLSIDKKTGGYYHQKYLFDPVKIKKGKWIGVNGKSIKELFNIKKREVLEKRGVFN